MIKGCSTCEYNDIDLCGEPCVDCVRHGGREDKYSPIAPTTRAEFLKEVEGIICKDRNAQYGEPEDNFSRIAKFWSDYLETEIDAADVAIMMSLFKIARIVTGGNKSDNWVDLIGYAACGAECAVKREG